MSFIFILNERAVLLQPNSVVFKREKGGKPSFSVGKWCNYLTTVLTLSLFGNFSVDLPYRGL